ncbi:MULTISPECIES: hypothetical protein [Pseudomonas]|uniref:Lipoprotein n=1 Tax=Pseudomonas quercus TaxID=2722792 RepID=A0ABX0YKZ3_9PSED|nr:MULTISPECIES: hypothetical protein [Pseudomonas]MBF7144425.1 hypothetical protein [Pseudomonas sp. LY10J]NJP02964.1 hypothetical protein [Pseudomonas quercus]
MPRYLVLLAALLLGACTTTPVPPQDPTKAWVEMFTRTGKLVMADKLDGKRLDDGRYYQVAPGSHELQVRFDYDVAVPMLPFAQPSERICYIRLQYDSFQAGERYRLEARHLGLQTFAFLYNAQGEKVATERQVNCLF